MPLLKLIVLEAAEVPVVSAHLQDATVRIADLAYSARDTRFALMCNRYHREEAAKSGTKGERRRAALRIERVRGVKTQGFDRSLTGTGPGTVLSVLAVQFLPDADAAKAPAGVLTITCAGNAAIRLYVECVELVLEDMGPVWEAARKPLHPGT